MCSQAVCNRFDATLGKNTAGDAVFVGFGKMTQTLAALTHHIACRSMELQAFHQHLYSTRTWSTQQPKVQTISFARCSRRQSTTASAPPQPKALARPASTLVMNTSTRHA